MLTGYSSVAGASCVYVTGICHLEQTHTQHTASNTPCNTTTHLDVDIFGGDVGQ